MAPAYGDVAVCYFAVNALGDIVTNETYDGEVSVNMSHGDLAACFLCEIVDVTRFESRHSHRLFEKKVAAFLHCVGCDLEVET